MHVPHSVRSICITAFCCLLGCTAGARALTERPREANANPSRDSPAARLRDWDLGVGTVKLPSYLADRTWYEYQKPGHELSSISISVSKTPPTFLSGWVQDQRARLQNTQLSEVSEVEKFSNPHFSIEGFWSREKAATPPTEVTYLLVLASEQDLVMFWIRTQPAMAVAVHAFAARIVPDDGNVPAPSHGWVWRRAFDVRLPIPQGASEPKQFRFEGERVTVLVTPVGPGQPLSFIPNDEGAKLGLPVEHTTKSVQHLPVRTLTSSGSDVDGEPMTLASATVEAAERALLLQARAFGERSGALISSWSEIATNATLRDNEHGRRR